ncbi:hypothetical protein DLM46_21860 [Paraburkholderia lacunae]|uniref:Uncharacterized protein n=2 Tax=Paraburkholderia lacunae TaxID=2211104 RepID=A0A370N4S8_9BURK|nr:hypothetical protein DLM46_21860 [Paraburkholderia lacunae]
MQQGGAHRRPAGFDTNRGSTIMIQTMMSTIGGTVAARRAQHQQQAAMLRRAVGFAIVTSGLAVIVAQALQHALGR